jgi:Family of unknown function (DUF6491)
MSKPWIGSLTVASTLVVLVLTSAGCATRSAAANKPAARSDDACVFSSTLDDYQPIDDERLILWAPGHRQPYLLTLSFPSTDLKWGLRLGFEDRDRNGLICGFGPDAVIVPNGIPDRITIRSMEKITPEKAKELLAAARKKTPKQPSRETSK